MRLEILRTGTETIAILNNGVDKNHTHDSQIEVEYKPAEKFPIPPTS